MTDSPDSAVTSAALRGPQCSDADAQDAHYILTLGCPDQLGIVANLSEFFTEVGGSISEAAYHADRRNGWFFTRQAVCAATVPLSADELRKRVSAHISQSLGEGIPWALTESRRRPRIVILVSRDGHCLDDIVARAYRNELQIDIAAVIGNHPGLEDYTRRFQIPFHYVPYKDKNSATTRLANLLKTLDPDAVVLARFMQIIPDDLAREWTGRMINIHHSFLPSFVGARPYHQAYERGVKLIGATCHYVTAELDAGPIIEQDVIRITHSDTIADMTRRGRDLEKMVLARGLRWHLENRVLLHGNKTVVFH